MFHNVLVAIDDSPQSIRALDAASQIARAMRGRLTVMTVATVRWTFGVPAPGVPRILDDEDAEARALIDESLELVRAPHEVEKVVSWGPSVADSILEQAERGEHDLIVLGSRGRGPVRATLLGSASRRVLDHSAVPVLIVRPHPVSAPKEHVPGPKAQEGEKPTVLQLTRRR